MRPDQHKKKKNSEYKKKHGISSNKGEKSNKKESRVRDRSDELKPESRKPKTERESEETDEEDLDIENNHRVRGTFSRRKIESNWDRYKENFEDNFEVNNSSPASTTPVGADYQSLLDKATGSSSHFQFKSEKDWEHLNYDEKNDKVGPSLMSIDCHALALSLRSISLEQRLDIERKYSIEEDYHVLHTNKTQVGRPVMNHHITDQETTIINNKKLGQNILPNDKEASFVKHNKSSEQIVKDQKQKQPVLHNISTPNEEKIQHNSIELEKSVEKLRQNKNTTKSNEEDDLELILGLDSKKELNSTHTENETQNQVHTSSIVTSKANLTSLSTRPQIAGDTKEDLEDWLDSILD